MRSQADMPTMPDADVPKWVGTAIGVVFLIPLAMLEGWVISVLWGWFVVPATGWPTIGIWTAAGLSVLVSLLKFKLSDLPAEMSGYESAERAVKFVIATVVTSLFALACGWVMFEIGG